MINYYIALALFEEGPARAARTIEDSQDRRATFQRIAPERRNRRAATRQQIDAIKRLRQARDLQLKDAKDAVDRHVRNNPALARKYEQQASGARRVLCLILVGTVLASLRWVAFSPNR